MRIGIIRETKLPVDRRTALSPQQVRELSDRYAEHKFVVQKSDIRAFADEEYTDQSILVVDDVSSCDVLFGVKEVEKEMLIPEKTYLFFSHTAKMQPYNQGLLQTASKKKISLIDYEYLTIENQRVVAFGYWAGIVGAYYALMGIGIQTGAYQLKPAVECIDLEEMKREAGKVTFPEPLKIVITGEGRVASGAVEILKTAGIKAVLPESYINDSFGETVFCQTGPQHYTKHKEGKAFSFQEFIQEPQDFESAFYPFTTASDVFIACHFWDPKSPVFFTAPQMKNEDFRLRFIADISCDIDGPVPTTKRASDLTEPFYGISRENDNEIDPFVKDEITVMAVDNLPGGIPRDASEDFGKGLIKSVIPELLAHQPGDIIKRATILKDGILTPEFSYLEDYLRGS